MSSGISSSSYSTPSSSNVSRATSNQVKTKDKDKPRKIHEPTVSSTCKIKTRIPQPENLKSQTTSQKVTSKPTVPKDSRAITTIATPSQATQTSPSSITSRSHRDKVQATPASTVKKSVPATSAKQSCPATKTPVSNQKCQSSMASKSLVAAKNTPTSTKGTLVSFPPPDISTTVPTLLKDCHQCRDYEAQILEIQASNKRKIQHYESLILDLRSKHSETQKNSNNNLTEETLSSSRQEVNGRTEHKNKQNQAEKPKACIKNDKDESGTKKAKNLKTIKTTNTKGEYSDEIPSETRKNWEVLNGNIEKLMKDIEWLVNTHKEVGKNGEVPKKEFEEIRDVVKRLEVNRKKMRDIFK
ncbi:hypothetical protein BZA77DRAFT_360532 [Pyronema omphalodes]|nr:hypothetical protein BZA77DRAFT_360532 [Pyronema omphalodes]